MAYYDSSTFKLGTRPVRVSSDLNTNRLYGFHLGSFGELGALGAREGGTSTEYDSKPLLKGEKYRIYMGFAGNYGKTTLLDPKALAEATKKEDPFVRFVRDWNTNNGSKFRMTKASLAGDKVYMEGEAVMANQTWGGLNIGWAWHWLKPFWVKQALWWEKHQVEGLNYTKILDSKGRDVKTLTPEEMGIVTSGELPGSTPSGTPTGTTPEPKKNNLPLILGGVAVGLTALAIGTAFLMKGKK